MAGLGHGICRRADLLFWVSVEQDNMAASPPVCPSCPFRSLDTCQSSVEVSFSVCTFGTVNVGDAPQMLGMRWRANPLSH